MQSRVDRLNLEVKTNETDEINKEIVVLNKELETFKENKKEILLTKIKPLKDKEAKLSFENASNELSAFLRKIPGKSKRLDTSKTDE
jgi:GTPase involved in cell partitioning and DNA repair